MLSIIINTLDMQICIAIHHSVIAQHAFIYLPPFPPSIFDFLYSHGKMYCIANFKPLLPPFRLRSKPGIFWDFIKRSDLSRVGPSSSEKTLENRDSFKNACLAQFIMSFPGPRYVVAMSVH